MTARADPIVLARAAYWRGRAAEAAGQFEEMRAQYKVAARYPTAYYGQLARARLGLGEIALRRPAAGQWRRSRANCCMLRKFSMRSASAIWFCRSSATSPKRAAISRRLQSLASSPRATTMPRRCWLLARQRSQEVWRWNEYAFPEIGVPSYSAIGPQIDQWIVYSIVRTESAFDQRDKSPAKAVGLMQVTPEAGRDTAKRFGVAYDWNRLVSDPVYNTQMGAAEISALLNEYRGSYIMTFAGYNAGRGRVRAMGGAAW